MDNQARETGILPRIEKALHAFVLADRDLLHPGSNLRTIACRMALCVQDQFPEAKVDSEFNLDGEGLRKTLIDPEHILSDDLTGESAYPDVVVHHRGTGPRILVIEIQRMASEAVRKNELAKLVRIKEEYAFGGALLINFGTPEKPLEGIDWV